MKTIWREVVISGILMLGILYFGTMLLAPEAPADDRSPSLVARASIE